MKKQRNRGYAYGVLAAVCFAMNPTIGKIALLDISPQMILVLKIGSAVLVLFVFLTVTRKLGLLRIKRKDISLMIVAGVFYTGMMIGFWEALNKLKITELLALIYAFPLIGLVFDMVQDRKLYLKGILLIAIGAFGVYLAVGGHVVWLLSLESGMVWALLSAVSHSVYLKMNEPLKDYPSVTKCFWQFLVGVLLVLLAYRSFQGQELVTIPVKGWGSLILLVTVSQLASYTFWMLSVKKIGAVATGTLNFLEPVIAVILAVVFFGESLTWLQVGGWGLILITLVNISSLRRRMN